MYNAVRKFLVLHHHLDLPGIGNFKVQTSTAQIDFVNRSIIPPESQVIFSNDSVVADTSLHNFLSQELKIDETQAIRRFTEFSSTLQSQLNEQKTIHLNGIGQLTRQSSNVINFQPEEKGDDYFPVLTAERVIRKNATHVVKVGEQEKTSTEMHTALHQEERKVYFKTPEKWWIPATILAIIGVAALIFYYTIYSR